MVGLKRVATSAHVEHRTDVSASPPNATMAAMGSAVAVEGSNTDQGGHLLSSQGPELWRQREQRAGEDLSYSRNTAKEILLLPPGRRAFDGFVEVGIDSIELGLEPLDCLADGSADALGRGRGAEAILLGGDHVDDLAATDDKGFEFLRLSVGKRS